MCGNLTYIYKDACRLAQAKCLARLIYHEPALEVRFKCRAAGTTSILSGSLLLKGHDEAKGATGRDLAIYGQENDLATWALARMNMFLHDCPSAEIWKGNTLSSPHFTEKGSLKTFDFVVANPPFSSKAWSNGVNTEHDLYGRFAFGVPPPKNGDYAFLLQVLASLKSTGKGAIIMPHGVLSRGNVEADIRREIVRRGYIKGITGLPANLFYGMEQAFQLALLCSTKRTQQPARVFS
jgi:type I restriction enzyme M protein